MTARPPAWAEGVQLMDLLNASGQSACRGTMTGDCFTFLLRVAGEDRMIWVYPPGNYSPFGRGSGDVNLAITKDDETILGDPRRHPVRYHADHCEREQRVLALADCDDPACQRYATFSLAPVTGGSPQSAGLPAGEQP